MWLIWIKPLSVRYNVNRAFSPGCKLIIPLANCHRHIAYRSFQVLPAISSTRAGFSLHDGITRHRLRLITDLGLNIFFHCICSFAVISTAYLLSFFYKTGGDRQFESKLSLHSLALFLNKTGGTRQFESKLSLHSLALFLNKTGGTRQFESKLSLHTLALFLNKTGGARQFESKLSLHSLALFF